MKRHDHQTLRPRMFGVRRGSREHLSLRLLMFCETGHIYEAMMKKVRSPDLTPTHVWRPESRSGHHPEAKALSFYWVSYRFLAEIGVRCGKLTYKAFGGLRRVQDSRIASERFHQMEKYWYFIDPTANCTDRDMKKSPFQMPCSDLTARTKRLEMRTLPLWITVRQAKRPSCGSITEDQHRNYCVHSVS